jgi:hypothetical protein
MMVRDNEGGGLVVTMNSVVVGDGVRICKVGGWVNIVALRARGRRGSFRDLADTVRRSVARC